MRLPDGWVPGEGPDECDCMIVGEAPGPQEWKAKPKRPFLEDAPAGGLLRTELVAAGLNLEGLYITNLVKVYPPIDGRTSKKLEPSPSQITEGLPYLVMEIRQRSPVLILALGETAYQALTGSKQAIGTARGSWCPLDASFDLDACLLPTYHPSWIKSRPQGRQNIQVWRSDIREFRRRCRG